MVHSSCCFLTYSSVQPQNESELITWVRKVSLDGECEAIVVIPALINRHTYDCEQVPPGIPHSSVLWFHRKGFANTCVYCCILHISDTHTLGPVQFNSHPRQLFNVFHVFTSHPSEGYLISASTKIWIISRSIQNTEVYCMNIHIKTFFPRCLWCGLYSVCDVHAWHESAYMVVYTQTYIIVHIWLWLQLHFWASLCQA